MRGPALCRAWMWLIPAVIAPEAHSQMPPQPDSAPVIVPKIWDMDELEGWATPLAGLGVAPSFVSEEEYYAAPIDNLRTYPVYHPDREPPGYRESLLKRGSEPLIEIGKARTREGWIEAGRRVWD